MSTKVKISISQSLYDDLETYVDGVAKYLADKAAHLLDAEYQTVIQQFYSEYEPQVYKRHHDRPEYAGTERGLDRTYEAITSDSPTWFARKSEVLSSGGVTNGNRFGGIRISTDRMYTDYVGTQQEVLDSFLEGFHGLKSGNIKATRPAEEWMRNYCNQLANSIGKYAEEAKAYAKKNYKYNMLY